MKKDGSANIQKTVLPLRKMSKSTVKKWSFAVLLLTNPPPLTITSSFAIESRVVP
jgi:hypothetical protein